MDLNPRFNELVALHRPGSSSRPPPKKAKVSDTTEDELPSSTIRFFKSSVEIKVKVRSLLFNLIVQRLTFTSVPCKVLKHLEGHDILAMWQASSAFHRALKDPLGLELWNEVRRASGLPLTSLPQLPTNDELLTMLYVLNTWCQVSMISTEH